MSSSRDRSSTMSIRGFEPVVNARLAFASLIRDKDYSKLKLASFRCGRTAPHRMRPAGAGGRGSGGGAPRMAYGDRFRRRLLDCRGVDVPLLRGHAAPLPPPGAAALRLPAAVAHRRLCVQALAPLARWGRTDR